jgi:hypothetical protein
MAGGMLVTALAVGPVAAGLGLPGVVVGLLVAGLAAGPVDVGLLTLRQRRTDPAQFGRVLAVSISLNMSGFPAGSAVAGLLIGHSVALTLLAGGVSSALAAIVAWTIPRDQ